MPGGVVATLPPGAGDGEGDASLQGPAQEDTQAQIEALPAQPKPANSVTSTLSDEPAAVIALAARMEKGDAAYMGAAYPGRGGLVTVQPKPVKRKNARERAKEKYARGSGNGSAKESPEDGTTPAETAKAKSRADAKAKAKAKAKAEKKERRKAKKAVA